MSIFKDKDRNAASAGKYARFDRGPIKVLVVGEAKVGPASFDQSARRFVYDAEGRTRIGCVVVDYDSKVSQIMSGPKSLMIALVGLEDRGVDLNKSVITIERVGTGMNTKYQAMELKKLDDKELAELTSGVDIDDSEIDWAEPQEANDKALNKSDLPF